MGKKTKKRGPGRPRLPASQQGVQQQIRATDRQWKSWSRAAKQAGVTRSAWIRSALDAAVEE